MLLSNRFIIALGNAGLGNTTEHSLAGDAAYAAFRFRRSGMKVYGELAERQKELRKEAGEDEARFNELNAEMLKDESEVWVRPISAQDYLALAGENKRTPLPGSKDAFIDFYRYFENDLEGILWTDENEN